MRNGSAAIVPLFLSIMTLFWFIWFLGGGSDTLHRVNEVENLQNLQERLLLPAVRFRNEFERNNPGFTEDVVDNAVDAYIDEIMVSNRVQKAEE